jgi:hypothetical protein
MSGGAPHLFRLAAESPTVALAAKRARRQQEEGWGPTRRS